MRSIVTASLLLALLSGCSTMRSQQNQLERVAKDWCMSVRASQIIPVYPLTEDVQVGDLFVVANTIEDSAKVYREKGFLPLDTQVGRLMPSDYKDFYSGAYGIVDGSVVPHQWQFPATAPVPPKTNAWDLAPGAAFPTYNFSVSRGGGLSLAIPVQAVPIGLDLLGTSTADGTITISNASTYGLSLDRLNEVAEKWASDNRELLAHYAPRTVGDKHPQKRYNYLRIINRVYVTGGVTVSISASGSGAAGLSAGVPRTASLPTSSAAAAADYQNVLTTLNNTVKANSSILKPGGSVSVASASSRTISMSEIFPRPLVIGYLAVDRQILDGGYLAEPHSAKEAMEQGLAAVKTDDYCGADANSRLLSTFIADPASKERMSTWLTERHLTADDLGLYILGCSYGALRKEAVAAFGLASGGKK